MKINKLVSSIQQKQGISIGKLAKNMNISTWILRHAKQGNSYLKKLKELNKLESTNIKEAKAKIKMINNERYVETITLLPIKSRTNFNLHYKNIGKNIRVWYQPKRRGKCELVLPKLIKLDEKFICNLGLSIGDGLNNPSIRNTHYNFANTNLDLIKQVYNWLIKDIKLDKENIQVYALASLESQEEKDKDDLSKLLKVDKKVIRIYKTNRNNKLDVILQVGNAVFQCLYLNLFRKLNKIIINDNIYRRAFLKGLFAAEGHVKHSIYDTVESMNFAFNPKTEKYLARFVRTGLAREGIKSKINNEGSIYFCNYNKMIRFYSLGLIDLNIEKRNKFLRLCKNAKIYLHFKKNYVKTKWKKSQYKLSKEWGTCQPTVCNYKNRNFMKFEIAKTLMKKEEIIENIEYIKVTNNTISNKENINFMINQLY